jgi:hypothetical protein
VIGVLLFHWQVFPIILLFWAENVVAGVFIFLKMRRAEGTGRPVSGFLRPMELEGRRLADLQDDPRALRRLFVRDYSIFSACIGIVVVGLFSGLILPQPHANTAPSLAVAAAWFAVAVVSVALGYASEYRRDFLGNDAYKRVSPVQVMTQPYARMILLALAMTVPGIFVNSQGAPLAALVLLALFQAGFDTVGWLRRSRATAPPESTSTAGPRTSL